MIAPMLGAAVIVDALTMWGVVGLAFAAVALGAWTVVALLNPSRQTLAQALQPYVGTDEDQLAAPKSGAGSREATETAFSRRAIGAAEEMARRQHMLDAIEHSLDRADIKLRPGELLVFGAAGAGLLAVLAGVLLGPIFALVSLVLGVLLPIWFVRRKAKRRLRKFVSQLPDTLTLLSGTLKAGYSLLQGINAVAQEVEDPMGGELRRILVEAQLGRPIEQALEECATRMASPDFEWAVMGINIQREVGGNLAELLSTVAATMTERERLRREVLTLTAEGRMSAFVLGGLPPGLGLIMWGVNPKYIQTLYTTSIGQTMLAVGSVWAFMGFIAMKKIVTIKF